MSSNVKKRKINRSATQAVGNEIEMENKEEKEVKIDEKEEDLDLSLSMNSKKKEKVMWVKKNLIDPTASLNYCLGVSIV